MKWWLIILLLAHVTGSFGLEFYDAVINWDAYAAREHWPPAREVGAAPIRVPGVLFRITRSAFAENRLSEIIGWWLSYLIPFSIALTVSNYIRGEFLPAPPKALGFEPIVGNIGDDKAARES